MACVRSPGFVMLTSKANIINKREQSKLRQEDRTSSSAAPRFSWVLGENKTQQSLDASAPCSSIPKEAAMTPPRLAKTKLFAPRSPRGGPVWNGRDTAAISPPIFPTRILPRNHLQTPAPPIAVCRPAFFGERIQTIHFGIDATPWSQWTFS